MSSPLAAHLGIVLVVKALLLAGLWFAFRADTVAVDPAAMAARAGVWAPGALPGEHRE